MKGETIYKFQKERAKEIANRMSTSISVQNRIYLSDRPKAPSVSFYEDEKQFFDSQKFHIHLGIYGPIEYFDVANDEEYISAVLFLFGHENQHVRSTAKIPYENGIRRAAHVIVEYIANKEGIKKIFRNDKDYEAFLNTDLKAKGIYVGYQSLIGLCAHLMNSIEDGRIERIRSLEFPGFEVQRKYFRAKEWAEDVKYEELDLKNPSDKLHLYMMVAHSLATKGLYPKGFLARYGNTEVLDDILKLMPYIGKGVLAGKTRDMADNVVKIAELLAPIIYEASKLSDAEIAFQQMLKSLLSQIASLLDTSQMANTSEREEHTDDGTPSPVFGHSDLVITLPDEEYDKLMEHKYEDGKGDGISIMIRREHPKDESDEGNDEGKGQGSGQNQKPKKDQKDGKENGDGNGQKSDENKEGNDSKNAKGDSNGNENSEGMDVSDGENSSEGSNSQPSKNQESNGSNEKSDKSRSHSDGSSSNNQENEHGSKDSGGGENGSVEEVLAQMAEAAKKCREDAAELSENINEAVSHTAGSTNRGGPPVVKDDEKPINAKDVKDVCPYGFQEIKRKYPLDLPLPAVLFKRAKAFRKKNERFFKSMSTPTVTHLDSGGVDPSLIYGLTFGETNIFRRIGQDNHFDGCVYILVDNSGSMAGNKRKEACKAAAIIEEGFKGLFPFKIVAFDHCGKIIHEVIKGWDESQKLNCCWNFANHGRSGAGNEDDQDILVAQRELLNRPEQKKLLIVLSDGAPGNVESTRKAIEDTRRKGISVFGIYFEEGCIGSDAANFQYMYQKDFVCCELGDVDNELTKLMMKFSRS